MSSNQCLTHDANMPCRLCLIDRVEDLEAQLKAIADGSTCCGNLWKARAQKAEDKLEKIQDIINGVPELFMDEVVQDIQDVILYKALEQK